MKKQLHWGIMGTGNIARQFADGVASAKRSVVVAAGSRQKDTADAFAARYSIPRAHASYEALLADDQVEAIYLSLPNSMHYQWTIAALEAGKHVLCEKPFAATADQARTMFDKAREVDRVLIEAFMYRCHPLTDAVIAEVRNGTIGQLQMIRTSFCFHTRHPESNARFSVELEGGSMMDIGCYCIDFSHLHAGLHSQDIRCAGHIHSSGIDDLAAGCMTFPNGPVASFVCGMTTQADNTAYLLGTEGFIEIPVPWKPPVQNAEYVVNTMTPPRQDRDPDDPPRKPREVIQVSADLPLYGMEADRFAETVLDGREPFMPQQHTIRNLQVLQEMRQQLGLPF